MQDQQFADDLRAARGRTVFTVDGNDVGVLEDIYFDLDTRAPAWLGVSVDTVSPRRVLVPVERVDVRDDAVYLPYESEVVKGAPNIDVDEITPAEEQELYAYYGVEQRTSVTEALRLAEVQGEAAAPTQTVTRHEEELAVGKEQVESGRVRMVKRVETHPVELDVALNRETARVIREPVDQEVAPEAAFVEEEVEITLTEERPVVTKRTVAKERVAVEKEVVTSREVVRDEVRKERIEVEGDVEVDGDRGV